MEYKACALGNCQGTIAKFYNDFHYRCFIIVLRSFQKPTGFLFPTKPIIIKKVLRKFGELPFDSASKKI